MSTQSVYAVASHRSFDNYFARFVGFSTDLKEITDVFPKLAPHLATLEHNKTLTFRRPYVDHHTPDEFVVLRYDVPATATQLHVQFVRWKYAGLTMSATIDVPPTIPEGVDLLNDCIYDATLELDPPSDMPTPQTTTADDGCTVHAVPPNSPAMTAIPV
jgi:hypothetical protein